VIIEDVHWADPETVAVIDYMADNQQGRDVMTVLTLRSGVPGAATEFVDGLLARRAARQIALHALDDSQVAQMIRGCFEKRDPPPELTEAVTKRSDGIPYFVEELLATAIGVGGSVHQGVPSSITAAIEPRLSALSDTTRDVVRHAALLGRQFDWEIAAAASRCGLDEAPERLREAVRAQLLDMEEAGFRFRHALTVDVIVGSMAAAERQRIAARLLAAVEERDPEMAGEHLQLAAGLAEEARQSDRAAELWLHAARRAVAEGSLVTAEAMAMRAGDGRPREAHMVLLKVLTGAGRTERVAELGQQLLLESRDPSETCEVLVAIARAAIAAGRFDDADGLLARARMAADDDQPLLARVAAAAAQSAMGRDDAGSAIDMARLALTAGEVTNQPEVICEALEVIGRAERGCDVSAAEAAFERARQVAVEHGLAVWRIRAMHELGTVDMYRSLASGRLERTRNEAADAGALATVAVIDLQLAAIYNERGEPDKALVAAQKCETTSRQLGLSTLAMSLSQQAMAHARAGRRSAMEHAAKAARATAQDTDNVEISLWGNAVAVYNLGRGELVAAAEALDRSMEILQRAPGQAYPFPGLWALLRTVLRDRGTQARERVHSLAFDTPVSRQLLLGAGAVAAGERGDTADAEDAFSAAEAALARYEGHFRLSQMRLLAARSAAAQDWGDPARWLREALATFETLGLAKFASQCRSELRELGEVVPRRTAPPSVSSGQPAVPVSLAALGITTREAEVLAYLAAGRSNRDIAETLFVSVRTVEKHVERILLKTGETRAGLAGLAHKAGIESPE
jgi:ATP/maltotriose-dependent transcriptional regulator MalT